MDGYDKEWTKYKFETKTFSAKFSTFEQKILFWVWDVRMSSKWKMKVKVKLNSKKSVKEETDF